MGRGETTRRTELHCLFRAVEADEAHGDDEEARARAPELAIEAESSPRNRAGPQRRRRDAGSSTAYSALLSRAAAEKTIRMELLHRFRVIEADEAHGNDEEARAGAPELAVAGRRSTEGGSRDRAGGGSSSSRGAKRGRR